MVTAKSPQQNHHLSPTNLPDNRAQTLSKENSQDKLSNVDCCSLERAWCTLTYQGTKPKMPATNASNIKTSAYFFRQYSPAQTLLSPKRIAPDVWRQQILARASSLAPRNTPFPTGEIYGPQNKLMRASPAKATPNPHLPDCTISSASQMRVKNTPSTRQRTRVQPSQSMSL